MMTIILSAEIRRRVAVAYPRVFLDLLSYILISCTIILAPEESSLHYEELKQIFH